MSSLRGFNGEKRQTDILNQLIKIDSKTGVLPTGGASEAKQELAREALTSFAEENNLDVDKDLIDLTADFQLAEIPFERSGLNNNIISGFNPNAFITPSYGSRMLDYFGLRFIIPNAFRNNNEEEQIIPNANLVELVKTMFAAPLSGTAICNFCCGADIPIPIRSLPASTLNKFASVSPSILKSTSAPPSLNTVNEVPISNLSTPPVVTLMVF